MKKFFKVFLKILLVILAVYFLVSSIYIVCHINFGKVPDITGPGFSSQENIIRNIMGIPATYTTYKGVSPIYLIEVVVKMLLAVVLLKFVFKKQK